MAHLRHRVDGRAALGPQRHVGGENVAAVAVARADDLAGLGVGALDDHALVNAALQDGGCLLLVDLAGEVVLDVVLRLLAERHAGLHGVVAVLGNGALQHAAQAALAGGHADHVVSLDDLLPVVERQDALAVGDDLLVHGHRVVEGRLGGEERRVVGKDGGVQVGALVGVLQVLALMQLHPLLGGVERHEVGGVGVLALLGQQAVLPQAVGVGDVVVVVHAGAGPTHEKPAVRQVVAEALALLLVAARLLGEVGGGEGHAERHLDVGLGLLGRPVLHEEVERRVGVVGAYAQAVALNEGAQLDVDLRDHRAVGAGVLLGRVDVRLTHGVELLERLRHDAGLGADRVLGVLGVHAGQRLGGGVLGQGDACAHGAHRRGGTCHEAPAGHSHTHHMRFPSPHIVRPGIGRPGRV